MGHLNYYLNNHTKHVQNGKSSYTPENRLLRAILGIQISASKETCLKLPIDGRGRVIDVRWVQKKGVSSYNPEKIHVYISQKREIKGDDKVAGRHGNKGMEMVGPGLSGR